MDRLNITVKSNGEKIIEKGMLGKTYSKEQLDEAFRAFFAVLDGSLTLEEKPVYKMVAIN